MTAPLRTPEEWHAELHPNLAACGVRNCQLTNVLREVEAAGERRGEERVRRIWTRHVQALPSDKERYAPYGPDLWWALTGEGDPPHD